MKINANPPAPYSVLNPETNSDSPSAKSKGVRLVSAKQDLNHTILNGNAIITNQKFIWYWLNKFKLNPPINITKDNKIKANLTSYEIVWATARRLPKREYLQFEDHPAIIVEYTPILKQHKKNKILKLNLINPVS